MSISLRERALEARRRWEEELEQLAVDHRARQEAQRRAEDEADTAETRYLAKIMFGEEPLLVEGYTATVEGLMLQRCGSGLNAFFCVLWACAACRATIELFLIRSLADLGRAYVELEGQPERFCHDCRLRAEQDEQPAELASAQTDCDAAHPL